VEENGFNQDSRSADRDLIQDLPSAKLESQALHCDFGTKSRITVNYCKLCVCCCVVCVVGLCVLCVCRERK
jgi:hypothetical protein